MDGLDRDAIASVVTDAVHAAMEARLHVASEIHREQHEWIAAQIAKDKARTEFWQGLGAKALPSIVWTVLVAAAAAAYTYFRAHWNP